MRTTKSYNFLAAVLIALFLTCASLPTAAQTFSVLHTFTGAPNDGEGPLGTLLRDEAGNLYGTTQAGGSGNCTSGPGCGTVYKLNKSGQEVGVFSFDGQDGTAPDAGLFRDAAGNVYGPTSAGGGSHNCGGVGCGAIFQLNRTGNRIRYYSFDGTDGESPDSQLIDVSGSLYGTTNDGGTSGFGTIFKINARGEEIVLYNFQNGGDGCSPGGLTTDPKGNLYGVASLGGSGGECKFGYGTAWELDRAGNLIVLVTFSGPIGWGAYPDSPLLLDSQGNLYGTALIGGDGDCHGGCGSVFELSPSNGTWSGRALYSFCSLRNCVDGLAPGGSIVRDQAGNIYGVTRGGGAYGYGTVFKVDTSGNETVLYSFTGGSDGAGPSGGLIMDASGNLYGTAEERGDTSCNPPYGCGVVFKVTP